MKVCIVGASGKLGGYMVQRALDRGYGVVGVCRAESVRKLDGYKDRIFGGLAQLVRFAELEDQVEACRRIFASNRGWRVVRGSDLEDGGKRGASGLEPTRRRSRSQEQPDTPYRFCPLHGGRARE